MCYVCRADVCGQHSAHLGLKLVLGKRGWLVLWGALARKSYWAAFTYLYVPSAKKPKEDLDKDYMLSLGHEDPPLSLTQRRQGIRRLQPIEVCETIVQHDLRDIQQVF